MGMWGRRVISLELRECVLGQGQRPMGRAE